MTTERIAILGGGCSGALLAAEILRQADRALEVVVVERGPTLGRGPAYATPFPVHVLNVPAGRLSAHAGQPDHFVEWLRRRDPTHAPASFVPRSLYGRYLEEVLAEARASAGPGVRFEHVQAHAVDLEPGDRGFRVELSTGSSLTADRVVLALGNLPPQALAQLVRDADDPARYVRDPWSPGALDFPLPGGAVLVMGTGLTAVDVVLGLRHRGHYGPVLAVSRHGLLPEVHATAPGPLPEPGGLPWRLPPTVGIRSLVAAARAQLWRARSQGTDWRPLIDLLRTRTQAIWRSLPPAERARFLRHVRPFWDAARHRMAPQVADQLDGMIATGALQVLAGRVESLRDDHEIVRARIRPRAKPVIEVEVRHVIDCTGPGRIATTSHPLLRRALDRGVVRSDDLGLGLDATPGGRLISWANVHGDRLFAMGPLLRGVQWETTAVAEIRAQAAELACTLVDPDWMRPRPILLDREAAPGL